MLKQLHRVCIAVLLLIGTASVIAPLQAQTLRIEELKASYINGFIDFALWDGKVNESSATIGIIGSSQLAYHLEEIASRKLEGRKLEIIELTTNDLDRRVDILFVGQGYKSSWDAIASYCRKKRVMLVGDEQGIIENGATIEFVVRKNRLRFIVNEKNAKNSGLEVSSKLLELAIERR
ncbi:MAG: YfiR family protein [Verrucomicrobiota bacterium]